jgi:hypothetical protein
MKNTWNFNIHQFAPSATEQYKTTNTTSTQTSFITCQDKKNSQTNGTRASPSSQPILNHPNHTSDPHGDVSLKETIKYDSTIPTQTLLKPSYNPT